MECVFKLPGTNCQIVIVNGNILQQEGVKIIRALNKQELSDLSKAGHID